MKTTPAPHGESTGMHAALCEAARRHGERPALSFVREGTPEEIPRRVSHQELIEGITRAANLFGDIAGPGAGVAFLLPSLVETHYVLWGAEACGYAVPLNPFLEAAQIEELVRLSGARILVTVGQAAPDIWDKSVQVQGRIPGLHLVCVGPAGPGGQGSIDFLERLAQQPGDRLLQAPGEDGSGRVVAYFHTGGTTGTPKLVAHTAANQLAAARGAAQLLSITPSDCITNGMPLFHVGGAIATGLAFLLQGAHVLMLSAQGFRNPAMVAHLWSLVERHRVTIIAAVPTALASVLSVPVNGRLDSVRYGLTGAALCPAGVSARFGQVTGKPLHELLGMTETGGVTAADPAGGTPTPGSVGIAIPGSRLRVCRRLADGGCGEDCAPGEIGVLFVTGAHVSPGYLDASQNQGVFTQEGLDSGDLAYFDAQGRLFIAGRRKDLIIRSGHNIDPAMIEQAFAAHPDVEAAAAVGQPDRHAGELPVVFLVLRHAHADLAAVEAFARARIAERPAWPKALYTLDALPLTAVGKPFKPVLRAQAAVRLLQPRLRELTADAALQVRATEGGKRGLDVQVLPGSVGSDAQALARMQRELDGYPFAWRVVHGAG